MAQERDDQHRSGRHVLHPWLLDLVTSGRLRVSSLVTHTLGLDRMEEAYEIFSHGTDTGALKVVLHRE